MSTTVLQALKVAQAELISAGITTSRLDAEVLMARVLATSREALFLDPERELSPTELSQFQELAASRAKRIPVARLLGEKEFWSLDFALNKHTLVPRPDSEALVTAALEDARCMSEDNLRILDLGTGSGCLLIALLKELPRASGVGIDIADEAILCAGESGRRHNVEGRVGWLCNDWLAGITPDAIDGPFDLIVSNPPYIRHDDIASLEPEVAQHDPAKALDGGSDGLDAYRLLADQISDYLTDHGRVVLEMGTGQAKDVADIFGRKSFRTTRFCNDTAGCRRVIVLQREQN